MATCTSQRARPHLPISEPLCVLICHFRIFQHIYHNAKCTVFNKLLVLRNFSFRRASYLEGLLVPLEPLSLLPRGSLGLIGHPCQAPLSHSVTARPAAGLSHSLGSPERNFTLSRVTYPGATRCGQTDIQGFPPNWQRYLLLRPVNTLSALSPCTRFPSTSNTFLHFVHLYLLFPQAAHLGSRTPCCFETVSILWTTLDCTPLDTLPLSTTTTNTTAYRPNPTTQHISSHFYSHLDFRQPVNGPLLQVS